jgi:negative regulator of sigma E activity
VVWLCREKGSDKVVAIVRGSIKDDKVDSMHMDHTSRYSDLMSAEATKRNVQSMIDALSSGEQYSGRVPTEEDYESMAESRAWLREHGQSEVAGDGE